MEDHLKNADRLQQEWIALCAYEAEPCATTMAQKVFILSQKINFSLFIIILLILEEGCSTCSFVLLF